MVTTNLVAMTVGVWAAKNIRAVPDTDSGELAFQLAYYGAMALAAVVDAFWLDEVLFRGAFRVTHFGGRRRVPDDESVDMLATRMQRSDISFPFSIVAFGVLTYLFVNVVNHDFDAYYRRVGKHVSALRGDDPATLPRRLEAIAALSIRREPEVLGVLLDQIERPGEVAHWAAWALGRFGDVPQRRQLIPVLVTASHRDDPALRKEALIALARLQHRAIARQLEAAIRHELEATGGVDSRLLYGAGATQVLSAVEALEIVLHRGDERSQRLAAWALAQHRDQQGGRKVVGILEQRLRSAAMPLRCAIVHSLGILADESSNLALMHVFDDTSSDERLHLCQHERIHMRPDGQDDRIDLLMPTDTFAMKVLMTMGQMRATTLSIRHEVEPWLERVASDPNGTPATQQAALDLLSGIRAARDDIRDFPSVDQVFEQHQ